VQRVAARTALPQDRFENTYTPALVNTGSAPILFDRGNGTIRKDPGIGHLRERLALAGALTSD
jgi:hypothetical protein